jgi:hypothetical protein
VARHERAYGRGYQVLNLEHYLDVLEKKPGAMADAAGTMTGSRALDGEPGPDLGAVAGAPQRVRRHARDDHAGARRPRRRWDKLLSAVEEALRLGSTDAGAVLYLLNMPDPEKRGDMSWR